MDISSEVSQVFLIKVFQVFCIKVFLIKVEECHLIKWSTTLIENPKIFPALCKIGISSGVSQGLDQIIFKDKKTKQFPHISVPSPMFSMTYISSQSCLLNKQGKGQASTCPSPGDVHIELQWFKVHLPVIHFSFHRWLLSDSIFLYNILSWLNF